MRPVLQSIVLLFSLLGFLEVASAQKETLIYPYAYQNQWGLVDENRTVLLSPSLDSIGFFSIYNPEAVFPRLAVALEDDKLGVINTAGEWVLKPKVDSIGLNHYYVKGLAWVVRKGKYGLMDFNGSEAQWRIKPRFTEVSRFRGRKVAVAAVAIDGRWGVVNSDGKWVAKCKYDSAELLYDFTDYPDIKLTKGEQTTYIDALGNTREATDINWEDEEIYFEDSMIEDMPQETRREHRITKQILAGGRERVTLEVSAAGGPYQRVEFRTIEPGYTIFNVVVDENRIPLRIKYVLVQKDDKFGFWGPEGLIAPGAVYDRIGWTQSQRYGQFAVLYRNGLKGLARVTGEPFIPAVFSTLDVRGFLFVYTHPDGYRGYADDQGRVFIPQEVILE
ncbi:MAG: WG repeat-containing protein [Bacteroidota bacterium]